MIPVRGAVSDSEQPVNQTALDPTDTEMSGLLRAWSDGDRAALDRLPPSFMTNSTASPAATCVASAPVTAGKPQPL
jgi:hypothetical protein